MRLTPEGIRRPVSDQPIHPPVELNAAQAAAALGAWLGQTPHIDALTPMSGGCVDTVIEAKFDGGRRAVIKVSSQPGEKRIGAEFARLEYYQRSTSFPVPQPHYCNLSGDIIPHSFFIMERLDGENLGEASWLSPQGHQDLQREIGIAVAELHQCRAPRFGTIGEALDTEAGATPENTQWWLWFQRRFLERVEQAEALGLIESRGIRRMKALASKFDSIFAGDAEPTLAHGDLWASNIIVRALPDGRPALSGFVDPAGLFVHPEYELAYLEIWQTVGEPFFEAYRESHDIDAGYPARRHFYWLNTLVHHANVFKTDKYVESVTELLDQIWAAIAGA